MLEPNLAVAIHAFSLAPCGLFAILSLLVDSVRMFTSGQQQGDSNKASVDFYCPTPVPLDLLP